MASRVGSRGDRNTALYGMAMEPNIFYNNMVLVGMRNTMVMS